MNTFVPIRPYPRQRRKTREDAAVIRVIPRESPELKVVTTSPRTVSIREGDSTVLR